MNFADTFARRGLSKRNTEYRICGGVDDEDTHKRREGAGFEGEPKQGRLQGQRDRKCAPRASFTSRQFARWDRCSIPALQTRQ